MKKLTLTGEYLRKYRLLRGLTQKELGKMTRQTRETVNKHENQESIPEDKQDLYKEKLQVMEYAATLLKQ